MKRIHSDQHHLVLEEDQKGGLITIIITMVPLIHLTVNHTSIGRSILIMEGKREVQSKSNKLQIIIFEIANYFSIFDQFTRSKYHDMSIISDQCHGCYSNAVPEGT